MDDNNNRSDPDLRISMSFCCTLYGLLMEAANLLSVTGEEDEGDNNSGFGGAKFELMYFVFIVLALNPSGIAVFHSFGTPVRTPVSLSNSI